jgi:thiol-disulfide isomerase/thioredoxin
MMMSNKLAVLSLAVLLMLSVAAHSAQADWQDLADAQATAEQEDNPAWAEYAFELSYAGSIDELSFLELARSEQPFVLFFWLTDCPVCHIQLPYVQQLEDIVEDNGLELRVVSINLDYDATQCLEFVEEKNPSFELLVDPRARYTNETYHLEELGTPITYVFDANGELVDYLTGFRSEYAKSILKLLDMDMPEGL